MGAYIQGALDSIAAQSYAAWEVVVVDDHAPEDGTHEIVKDFAARMPGHRVELLRHEHNQGVSAARNTGIRAARGEFVALLDPDDLWKSDHLEQAMEQFRQRDDLDVCTGPVEIFNDGEETTWKVTAQGAWHRRYFPSTLGIYNYIQPSASVVRKSALDAVGGFATEAELQHIEDYDLWIRLVERGGRFAFLREPTTRYRKHATGATSDVERMRALDARLLQRHPGFFRRAHATLFQLTFEDQLRLERELVDMRIRYNGPVMRTILALDGALRKLFGARQPPAS
jgi:glycosyltransferase involved in cell wall biosynthesis